MLWDVIIAPTPANSQLKYGAEVNENGATAPFSSCGNRGWRSVQTSSRSERPGKTDFAAGERRVDANTKERPGHLSRSFLFFTGLPQISCFGASQMAVVETAKGYLTDFAAGERRVDWAPSNLALIQPYVTALSNMALTHHIPEIQRSTSRRRTFCLSNLTLRCPRIWR